MVTKTKKSAVRKKEKAPKRALVCADNEQCFWTTDGQIISDLVGLRDALCDMAEDVFKYHVTKDKNDFATWIHDILHDDELAVSIRTAKKPKTAHAIVVRRLKMYAI